MVYNGTSGLQNSLPGKPAAADNGKGANGTNTGTGFRSGKVSMLGPGSANIIAHPVTGGYAFQPMLVINLSRYGSVWTGGGFVKTTRDTLFNNLYNYSSQGYYLKGGADLHLNFKNHRSSGFRLGGGINFARFTEKGLLQFQYNGWLVRRRQAWEGVWTDAGKHQHGYCL